MPLSLYLVIKKTVKVFEVRRRTLEVLDDPGEELFLRN